MNVLKSTPLRMFANYIAYKDKVKEDLYTIPSMRFCELNLLLMCLTFFLAYVWRSILSQYDFVPEAIGHLSVFMKHSFY